MINIKSNSFNLIRLICCLIVIIEHYFILINMDYLNIGIRHAAVCIFFVISGFWITNSFIDSKSTLVFYKKRVEKIIPLYYITIFFFFFYGGIFIYKGDIISYLFSNESLKYLLAQLSTLNFLFPSLPCDILNNQPINGSLWTIKIEVGFYLILPYLFYIKKLANINWNKFILICYILSGMFQYMLYTIVCYYNLPQSFLGQLPKYLPYFLSGMLFYFNIDKLSAGLSIFSSTIGLIIINLFLVNCSLLYNLIFPIALSYFVCSVAFSSWLLHIKIKNDLTYPAYLIHYPIIILQKNYYIINLDNYLYMLCVLLFIVFLFSCFMYHLDLFFKSKLRYNRYLFL